MAIRIYKPTTPGRRHASVNLHVEVTKKTPEKSLLAPLSKTGGRNNHGRKTSRHRGGGHKQQYRIIDFKRSKDGVPATVATIEYDPNRSARIALVQAEGNKPSYILAPEGLRPGQTVTAGPGASPTVVACPRASRASRAQCARPRAAGSCSARA